MHGAPRLIALALAAYASSCVRPPPRGESPQASAAQDERPEPDREVRPANAVGVDEPPTYNASADLDRAGILAEGAAGSGEIVFTFDDGPSPESTPEVLRVLEERKVKAAFFFTGRRLAGTDVAAEANRAAARAIARAGHTIGNHGLDHLAVNRAAIPWNVWQIEESARLIAQATASPVRYFRPPYGKIATAAQEILAARRDELVMWTLDGEDVKETNPERLTARLVAQILYAGQGIVLLHEMRPSSVRALRLLLDWIAAHPRDDAKGTGYTVVDLPTYLAHAAARPYPYPNRLQLYRARERAHASRPAAQAEI